MFQKPLYALLLEQLRRVLGLHHEPVGLVDRKHRQVEAGRTERVEVQRLRLHVRHSELLRQSVLELEGHPEQRVTAHAAGGPQLRHQAFEGDVLVLGGVEDNVADPVDQFSERGIAPQIGARDEHVDEEADEVLEIGVWPPRRGDTDRDVALAGVAVQQRLEPGEQHHEQRSVLVTGEFGQPATEFGRHHATYARAGAGGLGGPRPVRGQFERWRTSELLPPVRDLLVEGRLGVLLTLPQREVRVLEARHGEPKRGARGERRVARAQFAEEKCSRPAVDGDVVQRELEDVIVGGKADQQRAYQWAVCQIERRARLRDHCGFDGGPPGLRVRDPRQVEHRQRERAGRLYRLAWCAVHVGIAGPQDLVPRDDLLQALGEHGGVERAV